MSKGMKWLITAIIVIAVIGGGTFGYIKYKDKNKNNSQETVNLKNDENKQEGEHVTKKESTLENEKDGSDSSVKKIPYDQDKVDKGDGEEYFKKLQNSVALPGVAVDSNTESVAKEQTILNVNNFNKYANEYWSNFVGKDGKIATGGNPDESIESFANKGFYSSPNKLKDWLRYYKMGWTLDENGFSITKYKVDGIVEELISFVDKDGQKTAISRIYYRPLVGATEVRDNYLTDHGKKLLDQYSKNIEKEYGRLSQTPSK